MIRVVGAAIARADGGQNRLSDCATARRRCAGIRSVTSDPEIVADDQATTKVGGRPPTVTDTPAPAPPASRPTSARTVPTTAAAAVPTRRSAATPNSRDAALINVV